MPPLYSHWSSRIIKENEFGDMISAGSSMSSLELPAVKTSDEPVWMGTVVTEVLRFRHTLGLISCCASIALNELLMGTLEDLKRMYPNYCSSSTIQTADVNRESLHQGLLHFNKVLKSFGDSWLQLSTNFSAQEMNLQGLSVRQLAETALEMLKHVASRPNELHDLMDLGLKQTKPLSFGNPHMPTSELPEPPKEAYLRPDIAVHPPALMPLKKKDLSFHTFPLTLDHSTDHATQEMPEALINIEPNPPALIDHDDTAGPLTKEADEQTIEISLPTPVVAAHTEAVPQITNKENRNGDYRISFSEAKVFYLPTLQISKSGKQSPTPTPPASPMVLANIYMPFSSRGNAEFNKELPFSYTMAISDFDDQKPLESMLAESQQSDGKLHQKFPLDKSELPPSTNTSNSNSPLPQSLPFQLPLLKIPKPSLHQLLHLQPIPEGSVPAPSSPPLSPKNSTQSVPAPPPPTPTGAMTFTVISPAPPPSPPPPPPSQPGALVQSASPSNATSATTSSFRPPPPPPPFLKSCVSSASSTPLPAQGVQCPPPPPTKLLRAKETKLKRSTQMGNLYRLLKRKLEGSNLPGKASSRQKVQASSTSSGKKGGKGMAEALAEMTKRSSYFHHIEEDVQKYATSILEMMSGINNFQTKDMAELQKFHQEMEKHLDDLTDETQVLARFERFPFKKLESIRMAVALHMKLDDMVSTLRNWKIVHPIAKELDKIESYFNRIKEEVDAIERNKNEESKRLKSNNIDFDFGILMKIKEVTVDLSSNCIEMALEENKNAKERAEDPKLKSKHDHPSKLLWRAFQLAFRVYNFAGGQDERADQLTSELAREIENYSQS